ncbi:MAG: Hcp family type VI secretion system effector [Candidatus Heimdallarchaeota archaeon]
MGVNIRKQQLIGAVLVIGIAISLIFLGIRGFAKTAESNQSAAPPPNPMAAFLKIEGIDGGCMKAGHEGEIELLQFSHNIYIPRPSETIEPSTFGKRVHQPITVVKTIDKASPLLYQACTQGEHLVKAEIKWYRIDPYGAEEPYFTIILEDAIIVSIQAYATPAYMWMDDTGTEITEAIPMEEVSFTYSKITWIYVPEDIQAYDMFLQIE